MAAPFYPFYIKKEDAHILVKQQRNMTAIVLLGMAIVIGSLQLFVYPKLSALYTEFSLQLPFITRQAPLLMYTLAASFMGVSFYLFLNEPSYTNLNEKLKKYKAGEMIKTSDLIDSKKELWILLPFGLIIGLLVMSIILPIYSLTSNF